MSAKKAKQSSSASAAAPVNVPAASDPAATTTVAWIDSADPKKRQWAKIALVGVWLYVAALWLLALDQWLHWGIFGPKIPPV